MKRTEAYNTIETYLQHIQAWGRGGKRRLEWPVEAKASRGMSEVAEGARANATRTDATRDATRRDETRADTARTQCGV